MFVRNSVVCKDYKNIFHFLMSVYIMWNVNEKNIKIKVIHYYNKQIKTCEHIVCSKWKTRKTL